MIEDKNLNSKNRRQLIKGIGGLAAIGSIGQLVGCGGGSTTPGDTSSSAPQSSAPASSSSAAVSSSSTPASSSSVASSSSAPAADRIIQGPISINDVASGGTQSIQVAFPPANPFQNGMPMHNSCSSPTGDQILGPCHIELGGYRADITDGEPGVPVIYAFLVTDRQCNPIPGVVVHAWHTNAAGAYSADASQGTPGAGWAPAICSGEQPIGSETYTPEQIAHAKSGVFMRGANLTDQEGVAYFKSCFPGWYSGRTNHVHFRFVINNQDVLITQTAFPNQVCDEIHVKHPDYKQKAQDTRPENDFEFAGFFGGANVDEWIMDVARYEDGTLLITKHFVLNV